MDISILTVNWNAYDFAALLIESLMYCSKEDHPVIIVDNSSKYNPFFQEYINQPFVKHFQQDKNIGHGEGINVGLRKVETEYVFILDIDCHFVYKNWEDEVSKYEIVAGKGVTVKPLRPSCVFIKTKLAQTYDWRATPGYKGHLITPNGFDVGILAYHQMVKENRKIHWMIAHSSRYKTNHSEEWHLDGKSIIYHHWHGSHLKERQKEDYPNENLWENKIKLFKQFPYLFNKLYKLDSDSINPLEVT